MQARRTPYSTFTTEIKEIDREKPGPNPPDLVQGILKLKEGIEDPRCRDFKKFDDCEENNKAEAEACAMRWNRFSEETYVAMPIEDRWWPCEDSFRVYPVAPENIDNLEIITELCGTGDLSMLDEAGQLSCADKLTLVSGIPHIVVPKQDSKGNITFQIVPGELEIFSSLKKPLFWPFLVPKIGWAFSTSMFAVK